MIHKLALAFQCWQLVPEQVSTFKSSSQGLLLEEHKLNTTHDCYYPKTNSVFSESFWFQIT